MPIDPRRLTDFEGRWHTRRLVSHADGTTARFTGTAQWLARADGMLQTESGLLAIPDQAPVEARQSYHWGPDLRVYFADGRFFHAVPATGGQTEHWCDPDHYSGTYEFERWPDFRVTWDVAGPRKSYRMVSDYSRSVVI